MKKTLDNAGKAIKESANTVKAIATAASAVITVIVAIGVRLQFCRRVHCKPPFD